MNITYVINKQEKPDHWEVLNNTFDADYETIKSVTDNNIKLINSLKYKNIEEIHNFPFIYLEDREYCINKNQIKYHIYKTFINKIRYYYIYYHELLENFFKIEQTFDIELDENQKEKYRRDCRQFNNDQDIKDFYLLHKRSIDLFFSVGNIIVDDGENTLTDENIVYFNQNLTQFQNIYKRSCEVYQLKLDPEIIWYGNYKYKLTIDKAKNELIMSKDNLSKVDQIYKKNLVKIKKHFDDNAKIGGRSNNELRIDLNDFKDILDKDKTINKYIKTKDAKSFSSKVKAYGLGLDVKRVMIKGEQFNVVFKKI